jgi:hypothetical protein
MRPESLAVKEKAKRYRPSVQEAKDATIALLGIGSN